MATIDGSEDRPAPQQHLAPTSEAGRLRAWEVVETGRYRPLRIRGSFPGRELG